MTDPLAAGDFIVRPKSPRAKRYQRRLCDRYAVLPIGSSTSQTRASSARRAFNTPFASAVPNNTSAPPSRVFSFTSSSRKLAPHCTPNTGIRKVTGGARGGPAAGGGRGGGGGAGPGRI